MMPMALQSLEAALNAYLRLDPETIARLAKLSGKAIAVHLSDWKIRFFVFPSDNGVELSDHHDGEPDTEITGTLVHLFNLSLAKASNRALFENKIEVSGDVALGEAIRDIFTRIDIDWEEHLSRVVGDIAAHKLGQGFRELASFGKKTAHTIGQNLQDFLQVESKTLPTQHEVQQFVDEVSTLRHDVDRADARLSRLLSKQKPERRQGE